MKKIFCELCDGTEFTKDNGMFVCGGCGTRYTAEEAKAMMREVEGEPSVIGAAQPVSFAGANPNQQQIDNILMLATTAYEAENLSETETYCNRAIELDATCYKAWFLKGKAVGWSSKMDNNRFEEAAHSFSNAIDFAPEEEEESLKDQAVEEFKNLGLAVIRTRGSRFSKWPDDEELAGFIHDRKVLMNALLVMLSKGNAVGVPEGYLEQIANVMNNAAVDGYMTVKSNYNGETYPSDVLWRKCINEASNCEKLLQMAIDASDDDDDKDITRYENMIEILKGPMSWCSYEQQWSDLYSSFRHYEHLVLADSAKAARRAQIAECESKIAELKKAAKDKEEAEKRKAEEEKKARIKAYWDAHQDEKKQLDSELAELKQKVSQIEKELADLKAQIAPLENEAKGKVPSEEETEKLTKEIDSLKQRKAGLGLFAGKEKRQIDEQVAALEGRVSALKSKIAEEKKARTAEIDSKIKPLKDQVDELDKKKAAAEKRIKDIEAELTKNPEE